MTDSGTSGDGAPLRGPEGVGGSGASTARGLAELDRRGFLGCLLFSGLSVGGYPVAGRARAGRDSDAAWPQFQFDGANTGHSPDETGPKTEVASRWDPFSAEGAVSGAVVADGRVYFGGGDSVYAVEADSGSPSWSEPFETGGRVRTPAVVDGTVYAGSKGGRVYALDAVDGTERWRWEFPKGGASRALTVADGTVYAPGGDDRLFALDADDGDERWSVYTGECYGGPSGTPAVAGDTVYLADDCGAVRAIDDATGDQRWRFADRAGSSTPTPPTVTGDTVYFGTRGVGDGVVALSASDGSERWRFGSELPDVRSSPAVADGTVFFGVTDGNIYGLDAVDGTPAWDEPVSTGAAVRASPAVVGGVVYVGSDDGSLYGIDAATGETRFRVELGGELTGSPAVAGGVVYAGGRDGRLHGVTGDSAGEQTAKPGAGPWSQAGTVTAPGSRSGEIFGTAVSTDGTRSLVGAQATDSGTATPAGGYLFAFDGSEWASRSRLTVEGPGEDSLFGWSVALSGSTAMVAAPKGVEGETATGAVHAFDRDGEWRSTQRLAPGGLDGDARFGNDLDLSAGRAVVGAPDEGETGAVFVFEATDDGWVRRARLAPRRSTVREFGTAVALDGGTLLVWTPTVDADEAEGADESRGATYAFERGGGEWTRTNRFVTEGAVTNAVGKSALDVSGDRAVVAFETGVDPDPNPTAALLFEREGGRWRRTARFAFEDERDSLVGVSSSVDGDRAVVGASGGSDEDGAGIAHFLGYDGGEWTRTGTASPEDATYGYGYVVSLSGGYAFVGDPVGGSVYLFEHEDGRPRARRPLRSSRDAKLGLAGHIDEISASALDDRARSDALLADYAEAVENGTVSLAAAREAAERLRLGETVTELVLAYSGPGDAELTDDPPNLAAASAAPTLRTMVNFVLIKSALARRVKSKLDLFHSVVDQALAKIERWVSLLMTLLAGGASAAEAAGMERAHRVAEEVYADIESGALRTVQEAEAAVDSALDPAVDAVAAGLRTYQEQVAEVGRADGRPVLGLAGSLEHLHGSLDTARLDRGLAGDTAGARHARRISAISDTATTAASTIRQLDAATDFRPLLTRVVGTAPEDGGGPGALAVGEIVQLILDIVDVFLDAFETGVGIGGLLELGREHHTAMEGVLEGAPVE